MSIIKELDEIHGRNHLHEFEVSFSVESKSGHFIDALLEVDSKSLGEQIKKLIKTLKDLSNCPPLLIKIAPDLSNAEIDEISRVAMENGIDGIIAITTSLNRFHLKNLKIKTGNTLEQERYIFPRAYIGLQLVRLLFL